LTLVNLIEAGSKCGVASVNSERGWRIIGGVDAKKGEFPWQVTIKGPSGSGHNCGGTIINDQWILTAAHCPETSVIVLGDYNMKTKDGDEVQIPIAEWIRHPQDRGDFKNGYDVTIIKLAEKLDFEGEHAHLAPVCLASDADDNEFAAPDALCTATGWGYTQPGRDIPDILQKVDLSIWDNADCGDVYSGSVTITKRQICAGGDGKHTTCNGDSGGPIQCRRDDGSWVQVGVTSFGINGCLRQGYPGAFSRVSQFTSWIQETIADN